MTTTEDIIRLKDAEIWSLRSEINKLTIKTAKMEVELDFHKQLLPYLNKHKDE